MSFEKQYDIIGGLGAGVYGQVYKVQRKSDGVFFAAKRILMKDFSLSELDILGRFDSDFIIESVETFFYDDGVMIILPLMDDDLKNYIRKNKLSVEENKKLLYQIAAGLDCLHEKYYHCDLKPDNILIKKGTAYISDFSLAYSKDIPRNKSVCTAVVYRPPEYFIQTLNIDDRYKSLFEKYEYLSYLNDLWGYGCIAFFILSRKHFLLETLDKSDIEYVQKNPDKRDEYTIKAMEKYLDDPEEYFLKNIPDQNKMFIPFLLKLLAPNQNDRYQSADDILRDPIFISEPAFMCSTEGSDKIFLLGFPMTSYKEINPRTIFSLFQYLLQICYLFNMRAQTFIFAVDLIARTLPNDIPRTEILVFGMTCLYIAGQLYEPFGYFNIKRVVKSAGNSFTELDVIQTQNGILRESYLNLGENTLYDYARDLSQLKYIFNLIFGMGDELFTITKDELEEKRLKVGENGFFDTFDYVTEYDNVVITFDKENEFKSFSDINSYRIPFLFPNFFK